MAKVNINDIALDATTFGGDAKNCFFQHFIKIYRSSLNANQWYRLALIGTMGTTAASILVSISVYQSNQPVIESFLISRNTFGTSIKQLGGNQQGYSNIKLRVVKASDQEIYIDFMNPYGSQYRFNCGIYSFDCDSLTQHFDTVSETQSNIEASIEGTNNINLNSENMINNNVVEHNGGGYFGNLTFEIGDYAVFVRKKGGQRNGQDKHSGLRSPEGLRLGSAGRFYYRVLGESGVGFSKHELQHLWGKDRNMAYSIRRSSLIMSRTTRGSISGNIICRLYGRRTKRTDICQIQRRGDVCEGFWRKWLHALETSDNILTNRKEVVA